MNTATILLFFHIQFLEQEEEEEEADCLDSQILPYKLNMTLIAVLLRALVSKASSTSF